MDRSGLNCGIKVLSSFTVRVQDVLRLSDRKVGVASMVLYGLVHHLTVLVDLGQIFAVEVPSFP